MNKLIIIINVILFSLASSSILSQNNSSFDIIIGFQSSNRILDLYATDLIDYTDIQLERIEQEIEIRNANESSQLNLALGFNYNLKLKNIFFKSGLRITQIGYNAPYLSSSVVGPIVSTITGNYDWRNFLFIEIPTMFRYEFRNSKLTSFIELGGSHFVYLGTQLKSKFQTKKLGRVNSMIMSLNFSSGLNYKFNPNLKFIFQPTFQYFIISLRDELTKEYIYRIGIELGIRKRI